ncbi:MAG: hypothetical protein MJE12_04020 [Alphaproteobacteria bacterium]|nr:hypothetical protein [Alphaproteobacteria bacterium]
MSQLNIAATFAAATVLTVFAVTCWYFEGQPFESPAKAVKATKMVQDAEGFGGMFGVRGPVPLDAAAWSRDGRIVLDSWKGSDRLPR